MSFYQDKKIVVTGGSGFLGSNYIESLVKRGAKVTTHIHQRALQTKERNIEVVPFCDLTKIEDCIRLVDGADYVIHSGGNIAHPSTVPTDIQISIQNINVLGNVLDACNRTGVKKLLDLNSSTGYPDRRYPITEDEYWDDEPFSAYYGYGWMRRYREKLMEHVSKFSDLQIMIARGTAIFGPYDNFDVKTCHVVPAMIKRVLTNENPFIAWGDPNVVRDFLYVEDVIKAALLVLEKGEPMRPYNVGMGKTITIGEILNTILEVTNKSPEVIWDNSKPTTIPFRMVSVERIKNELGFVPDYSFKEGIEKTVNWFLENHKEIF